VKHLYGHSGSITGLSYSTDQAILFSSSADGTVRLWSTQWCKNLAAYRWVVYPPPPGPTGVPGLASPVCM
jgi:WD40 repeat protein